MEQKGLIKYTAKENYEAWKQESVIFSSLPCFYILQISVNKSTARLLINSIKFLILK